MKKTLPTITAPLEVVLGNDMYLHFLEVWKKKALIEVELIALDTALTQYDHLFKRPQLERMLEQVRQLYESQMHLPRHAESSPVNPWIAAFSQVFSNQVPKESKTLVEVMAFKLCLALISMLKKEIKPEHPNRFSDEESREEYKTTSNDSDNEYEPDERHLDPSEMTIEEQVKYFGLNPDSYF